MTTIDLNADMGEYANETGAALEANLMALISSCSIACGGHAGDAQTMTHTLKSAKKHGVIAGAHPSYPDKANFGRVSMTIDHATLHNSLRTQINALSALAENEGMALRRVKAHGALYNDAAKNIALARLFAKIADDLAIVGPPGSALEQSASEFGARFIAEGFVDRLYQPDGSLTPRGAQGAVIANIKTRAEQAVAIAKGDAFPASTGDITIMAKTLCIHSDSDGAVETATAIIKALDKAGIAVKAAP